MCLAIPGQIVAVVDGANRLAQVDVAGVKRTINIGLLDDGVTGGAGPGDWVLIHVGFALSKVDEEEAVATLKLLEGMGAEHELALCEAEGEKETVEVELVGPVAPGDALLVHAGTALQHLGAAIARPD